MSSSQIKSYSRIEDVMSALKDVILSQQATYTHDPTPTEYFAAISSTLTASVQTEHMSEMLEILSSVLPNASTAIVRMQFRSLSTCLLRIVNACDEASQSRILRLALESLGLLANEQELSESTWGSINGLQTINCFLSFVDHTNLKLRRTAHERLFQLLLNHQKKNFKSILSYVADFCLEIIRGCTRSEYKRSMQIIIFLEKMLPLFPEAQIVQLIANSMALQKCSQPILIAAVYRMCDSFYQHPNFSSSTLSDPKFLQCFHKIVDERPSTADMEALSYYATASASGLVCFYKINHQQALTLVPQLIRNLIDCCDSEFTQIHCGVSTAIKRIIATCIQAGVSSAGSVERQFKVQIINSMVPLIQLRYQHAWIYMLESLRFLFEKLRGEDCNELLRESLVKMANIYDAIESGAVPVDTGVHTALGNTIGSALKVSGVVCFLRHVPLHAAESPSPFGIDNSREWVLSILSENLRFMPCALADFGNTIFTIAKKCNHASKNPDSFHLTSTQIAILRTRVLQLWSLFPEFCYFGITDVGATFPKVASIFDGILQDETYPELAPLVITGLTSMVKNVSEKHGLLLKSAVGSSRLHPDLKAIQDASGIFIPTVLKFLESTDVTDGSGRFQQGVASISAWCGVAPAQLVTAVAKKLLELLLMATKNSESADNGENVAAAGWMSIMMAIVPHLPDSAILLFYRTVKPLLPANVSTTLQKRAYSVLDSLLKTHGAQIFSYEAPMQILLVISDSLLTCHVSARNMRLRCIETLLRNISNEDEKFAAFDSVMGEILLCQKDANKKARDCAMDLMKMMIQESSAQSAVHLFNRLLHAACSGNETSLLRSSAIVGLCMLLLERRGDVELLHVAVTHVPSICSLLEEQSGDQTRSVLSFLRVCAAILPVALLEELLPAIVFGFTDGLKEEKSKYLSRSRAIVRKLVHRVDTEALRAQIPATDQPLLNYVLKMNRRGKRKKVADQQEKDRIARMLGSDSDNDSDDEESNFGDHEPREEDPRLSANSRPKAIRAAELLNSFPSTLADLLEDRPTLFVGNSEKDKAAIGDRDRKKKKGTSAGNQSIEVDGQADDESDYKEAYSLIVTEDGQLIVKEREVEAAPVAAASNSGGPSDVAKVASVHADKPTIAGDNKKRVREPGEEYRSKKAGGDVWKHGLMQPHAYIPLDPRLLSKKNKVEGVKAFGSVIKSGKDRIALVAKGAMKGNRNQRRAARDHK